MNTASRRVLLAVGLIASLAAARWVGSHGAPTEAAASSDRVKRTAKSTGVREGAAGRAMQPEHLALEKLHRQPSTAQPGNLFAHDTWGAPQPQRSLEQPPEPPPAAPPLPFTYFGRMSEAGGITVFLNGAGRNHAVRVGDVLDERYRIEAIDESELVVTYLPLQQRQTLRIANN